MNNKKQNILIIVGLIVLVGMIGGVTFAFFNFTRTGNANTIRVGKVTFDFTQDQTINLSNMFPIDPTVTGIMDDETKVGTLEINITGDTDYADGLEYLITTSNSELSVNGKVVPISIDVTVSGLGTEKNGLDSADNDYFKVRENKNVTIYKRLSGDVVVGDQQLLVGYIKPNTTRGEAEGVTGSITIKAYFDKNRIAISDTYDDTGIVSALNGTTDEWVDDRVYLTTTEWNSLQTNGISFQVRVEANEGIWVDEPIYNKLRINAVMDNIRSTNVSSSTGIDFSKISGDTDSDNEIDNGEGLYVRAGTENDAYPVVYYRGNVSDNNVYFGGKCWQMVRTTDTGGVKMIYNGKNTGSEAEPKCENTEGTARQITLNIDGVDTNTFSFSGTGLINSPSYNGYMYKSPVYSLTEGDYAAGSKFGNGVVWNGTSYTLTDVSDSIDTTHHYTCGTANTTSCSTVRYYSACNSYYKYYFTLTNGKTIEDVVRESLENGATSSNAKTQLETWYEENLSNTGAESKLEDAVYCNDRSIYSLGGMNPNGGTLTTDNSTHMFYSGYKRLYVTYTPSTKCRRVADSFTKNSTKGNGLLGYSVGLITADEIALAGGKAGGAAANFYLKTGANYWSASPYRFTSNGNPDEFYVYSSGFFVSNGVRGTFGLRPVVSLKLGTSIASGDGSVGNPYLIKK